MSLAAVWGGPVGDGQLGLPFASAHFFLVQKELSVTLSLKAVLQGRQQVLLRSLFSVEACPATRVLRVRGWRRLLRHPGSGKREKAQTGIYTGSPTGRGWRGALPHLVHVLPREQPNETGLRSFYCSSSSRTVTGGW